ncbi:hypothetical protein QYE76_060158 [Lolium multiflorum]|uniref:GRAS family transcription factor n=1 Tax=Lolium multiflorum TaxID=4521 RepID=A0AAD8RZX2_LOLMU|nr:hypothetical protein QYE76_060158 [Lolium multiflorum]
MMGFPRGDLKKLLIACARAIDEEGSSIATEAMVQELRKLVSVSGEPLQRLGAYMVEGLAARLASSTTDRVSERKKPKMKKTSIEERISHMETLHEVCRYFRSGYMSANGAIKEAVRGEAKIHIIDFHITGGSQLVGLIEDLSRREGGPPTVRITGIDDSVPTYARGSLLEEAGRRLQMVGFEFAVPLEFHAAAISVEELEGGHLAIIPGEALVVNFNLGLHRIPDDTVSTANHRDRILRLVKSLSPKVVTLVEQELDTNTGPFNQRFMETLDYYATVFESIDLTLISRDANRRPCYYYGDCFEYINQAPPNDDSTRIGIEQHCLGREVVSIVACEGAERVERHEPFNKWKVRLTMAGFTPSQLDSGRNDYIRERLQSHNCNYLCDERDGVLYLGWKDRPLVVTSAWH